MSSKIKSKSQLIKQIEDLKKQGNTIVTCNGSFDIIHAGHVKLLKEAKKQGDYLIVLLNSDKSVNAYKGPNRPINSEEHRAEVLANLESVDLVTIFDELTPVDLLDEIEPDIHCAGKDWGESCIERKVIEKNGGKLHLIDLKSNLSTTDLINNLNNRSSENKAVFLDRDGTINKNKPEYLHKIKNFEFTPQALPGLKKLSKSNYKIIITTNQSGIGRGYYKQEDMEKLHKWLKERLKKEGIAIDKIYHCPHHPNNDCSCRKPNSGMFLKARKEFKLNLNKSWIIGDSKKDVIAGRKTNIKTIKLGGKMPKKMKLEPNYYAENILEAVNLILKHD